MSIYIPGHGEMSWDEVHVDRAVKEYDERLFFARNADTWDYCVFIKMPRPREPFPVLGFGREVPTVDHVMSRLREGDTMRNGNKVYDEIIRSQEEYRKNNALIGDEAAEESAEVVEHFMRQHGKSPVIKEFIASDIPKGGEAGDS